MMILTNLSKSKQRSKRPYHLGRIAAIIIALINFSLVSSCATYEHKVIADNPSEKLQRDIKKVQFAIETTKTLIARERGANYLPDLYLRLAELYVEEARYHYQLAYEKLKQKSLGVISPRSRLLKEEAISTYRRLLDLFPDYQHADRVLFLMAHEMRELGDYENMLKTYLDLSDRYPKSNYRYEGLLVVGDYYFDQVELEKAKKYYQMVISGPGSRVHAMAYYKNAWCEVNQGEYKQALSSFENSIKAAQKYNAQAGGKTRSGGDKIDLRREALVDSVFCYTEARKPDGALKYFHDRADSKTTYVAAIDKLGNRYYVKQNWKAVAMIYRELLMLTGDNEDSLEYAHRLYEGIVNSKQYDQAADDVQALVQVIMRRYHNQGISAKDQKTLFETFEKYTRDIATRLHETANQNKDVSKFKDAARAYAAYLLFFKESPQASLMISNMAEAQYAAKNLLEAGRYYEMAAKNQKDDELANSYYTAVVSYFEALNEPQKLSRLEIVQARAGLRRAGKKFIALQPKNPKCVQMKFNIARTYYDAGDFHEAIRLFTALVRQYPTTKEAPTSAHLTLDSYRNLEDYEGLAAAGRDFAAQPNLGDGTFKSDMTEIVKRAESNILVKVSLGSNREEGASAQDLMEFEKKHAGSQLGEQALYNAFEAARATGDSAQIFAAGEKFYQSYPNSESRGEILSTMGKIALDSFQFKRAANYYELVSRLKRKDGKDKSAEFIKASAQIYIGLGDRAKAEANVNAFLRTAASPEEKSDLLIKVIGLHRKANDLNAVINTAQQGINAGLANAEILYLLGYSYFKLNRTMEAQSYLNQALTRAKEDASDNGREIAAAVQYYLSEILFRNFEQAPISPNLNQLGPTLQQKLELMAQTSASFKEIVKMGSGMWSIAALGRLAAVDKAGADALTKLTMPDGLAPEAAQQIKTAMDAKAAPLLKEAEDALKQCATIARKYKILSESAKACIAEKVPTIDPLTFSTSIASSATRPQEVANLERQLLKQPNDLPTIQKLGELYLSAGNVYMARLVFSKGLEIGGGSATILNYLGVVAGRLGEPQEAMELFDRALQKDSSLKAARLNRAFLLAQFNYQKESQAESGRIKEAGDLSDNDPRLLPGALRIIGGR